MPDKDCEGGFDFNWGAYIHDHQTHPQSSRGNLYFLPFGVLVNPTGKQDAHRCDRGYDFVQQLQTLCGHHCGLLVGLAPTTARGALSENIGGQDYEKYARTIEQHVEHTANRNREDDYDPPLCACEVE
jgi:hypothetical protein